MEHIIKGFPQVSSEYLKPTTFFDFDRKEVRSFSYEVAETSQNATERAIKLFYAVRDEIRYDPYSISLKKEPYKASNVLEAKRGYCLPKANLLIACCRSLGIPAGIGLSNVYNHLCTDRLRRMMGGKNLFLHHGYAVLFIDGQWVKAAPAFNIELCTKFNVLPTEFDGKNDALFQPYDADGRLHMEYDTDHGIWSDFPLDRVATDFRGYYPSSVYDEKARAALNNETVKKEFSFEDENPVS
jgi:transglutaminase-like putative cysteine protease